MLSYILTVFPPLCFSSCTFSQLYSPSITTVSLSPWHCLSSIPHLLQLCLSCIPHRLQLCLFHHDFVSALFLIYYNCVSFTMTLSRLYFPSITTVSLSPWLCLSSISHLLQQCLFHQDFVSARFPIYYDRLSRLHLVYDSNAVCHIFTTNSHYEHQTFMTGLHGAKSLAPTDEYTSAVWPITEYSVTFMYECMNEFAVIRHLSWLSPHRG